MLMLKNGLSFGISLEIFKGSGNYHKETKEKSQCNSRKKSEAEVLECFKQKENVKKIKINEHKDNSSTSREKSELPRTSKKKSKEIEEPFMDCLNPAKMTRYRFMSQIVSVIQKILRSFESVRILRLIERLMIFYRLMNQKELK
ncbi:hypothetical protein JTB14_033184 [Gonioctena quinquepunctata]|nr:hypothetical protein JTB14_033184 [Gonioctena quinquepunctata]